ncbi:MAG: aldo/keto reductase family protein [Candidatus Sericytochromatia bacterium]
MSDTSVSRRVRHRGVDVPSFLYGTAWKEDRTEALVKLALESGFLGIDTANQRKHYFEAGVGQAVRQALAAGTIDRAGLFLQTKFTFLGGQDHRLPYDPQADYPTQVRQSFASSLEHLGTDYLDSYVLHGPSSGYGLNAADLEVWRTMEELQQAGQTRLLGVSNVSYDQLQALLEQASVKPAFVQNRCYARSQWDARVRELCRAHDVRYQGFSLLTANARELNQPRVHAIAQRLNVPLTRVVFRFALQLGMLPLTGTSDRDHMLSDLAAYDLELSPADMATLEAIGV